MKVIDNTDTSKDVHVNEIYRLLAESIRDALENRVEMTPHNVAVFHEALMVLLISQFDKSCLPLPILLIEVVRLWEKFDLEITDVEHEAVRPVAELARAYIDGSGDSGCVNPHCPIHKGITNKPS
jgi:hypothetical protein